MAAGPATNPIEASTSTSRIQIVYGPADLVTTGDCESRITNFVIRTSAKGLHGPLIASGTLEDKDSQQRLPAEAFEVVTQKAGGADCENAYDGITQATPIPDSQLVRLLIRLKANWVKQGMYSGTLWLAAAEDTAGQAVQLKVAVRPQASWWIGIACLAAGAGLSWFATVRVSRLRQSAGNEIVVARLHALLERLILLLGEFAAAGAPRADHTLDHIRDVRANRLRTLLTDKELSVLAGVTVPPVGSVSVTDEVESLSRIVLQGFGELMKQWRDNENERPQLAKFFQQMDSLGEQPRTPASVEQEIKTILAAASATVTGQKVLAQDVTPPLLPREDAVVHRVVFTTHLLDLIAVVTVVVLGAYVIIWKNPGFGSLGDLFTAFFWGLGVKLGTDVARLGPGDVRTAYGIKIPGSP